MRVMDVMMRWLVGLTPRHFRERFGAELIATFRRRGEQASARGRGALIRFCVRELGAAVWLALRLRVQGTPQRRVAIRSAAWHDGLMQDVRFAFRTLGRNPGYSAAAVVVLALGIGPAAAIFSAANASFFRPLPFELLLALPYLVVIAALAISGRNVAYPGAYLRPYRRS